jgi:SAM-dependent methyltransferase
VRHALVTYIIVATNGLMYRHLVGNLDSYPIPDLRLPDGNGQRFLDLGCNWGRWCIAAARKGYDVIGIDPSLGAIMAAKRVSESLCLSIKYVVADARYLPFSSSSFNSVFSYSVLQHLSRDNVRLVLSEVSRVLKPQGTSFIQMPTILGLRCIHHQARRWFREAQDFEVRYWSIPALKRTFTRTIGRTEISVHCYFGIGLQKSDSRFMPRKLKFIIASSELLRRASRFAPFLKYVADSVYVKSVKP